MFASIARFAPKKAVVANKLSAKAYNDVVRKAITNEVCEAAAAAVFTPVKFATPTKAQIAKKQAAVQRRALRRKALAATACAQASTNDTDAILDNIQEVASAIHASGLEIMASDAFVESVEITTPVAEAIAEPTPAVEEEFDFQSAMAEADAVEVPESFSATADPAESFEATTESFEAAEETAAPVEAESSELTADAETTEFTAEIAAPEEESAFAEIQAEATEQEFVAATETETENVEVDSFAAAEAQPEVFTADAEPETFAAETEPECFTAECDVEETFVAAPEVPVAEAPSTFESAMADYHSVAPVSSSAVMVQEAVDVAATAANTEVAAPVQEESVEEPVVFRNLF